MATRWKKTLIQGITAENGFPKKNQLTMDGTLFNIEDYTDERVRRIMQGKTCRTCDNRVRHGYSKSTYYCKAHESGRTANGLLKVKANQPACIRYTNKDNQ